MLVSTLPHATAQQRVAREGDVAALPARPPALALAVYDELAAVADDWRRFELTADCTAFQTFAWHSAWHRHIGARAGVKPTIVVGRGAGRLAFIFPFAIEPGRLIRRLVWHASDLCDYNAPLIAPAFAQMIGEGGFAALFAEIAGLIAARTPFDAVVFTKMPETVGGQRNPFLALATTLDPNGAYLTRLTADWKTYYAGKRSAATRRRDRNKRKHLADFGPVRFVTPPAPAAIAETLATLFDQKSKAFAHMGVPDLFAKPGVRDFFVDLATAPATRDLVHVSHLEVGPMVAAANLGLIFRGRYYHVLASYDAGAVAKFGPGAAHLHELMAFAIARGCETFDFTIGDERYKREWAEVTVALHDYRRAASLRGLALVLMATATARVKRFIKQNPTLWSAALKVREIAWRRSSAPPRPKPAAEDP